MDVRLSAEQQALRDSAAELVQKLGPHSVLDLDDAERAAKLDAAIESVGWRELRTADEDGNALASAVETALIAAELARGLADAAFLGPTLAAELRRLAGAPPATSPETVALTPGLTQLAVVPDEDTACGSLAIDALGSSSALVLISGPAGYDLATVPVTAATAPVDLTRPVSDLAGARAVRVQPQPYPLSTGQLRQWTTFAVALACADLVGTMAGAIQLTAGYAKLRQQFGQPIGAFQAVQHTLADSFVAAEGSRSIAMHAAWAAESLPPSEADVAARAAKAYCSRAARTVCEAAVQVHGGIGNTWECAAHLYLRRALLTAELLGGPGESVQHVLAHHLNGASEHGL